MNVKNELKQVISGALKEVFDLDIDSDVIRLKSPSNTDHGDFSVSIAMQLAKNLKKSPKEIAEQLIQELEKKKDLFKKLEVAGPGFINMTLQSSSIKNVLRQIGSDYGEHQVGRGKAIMVEYGQANTHKAFHVGHLKSAISGRAIVGLYRNLGYKVVEANFYGDVGMHVAKCTWGAIAKGIPNGMEEMDMHERMEIIDGFYVHGTQQFSSNPEVEKEIRLINNQIYSKENSPEVDMYLKLRDWSLEHLDNIFAKLGVHYDVQYPESVVTDKSMEIVNGLKGNILELSEGAWIFPGEKQGLNNWVFITGEGLPTYEAKDLGLALQKFDDYKLDYSVITTSMEQADRFKSIIWILEKINPDFKDRYKHLPFGWLLRNNKKTSSRMGESIKGIGIMNEAIGKAKERISVQKDYTDIQIEKIATAVGMGGLKFLILSHEFHKDINYDPDEFTSFEGFSGPYIMYAYSRINSILDKSEVSIPSEFGDTLESESEKRLLKKLIEFPEITLAATNNLSPHILSIYLFELAAAFNRFYETSPILKADTEEQKQSRLLLASKVKTVLSKGMNILGIDLLEKM